MKYYIFKKIAHHHKIQKLLCCFIILAVQLPAMSWAFQFSTFGMGIPANQKIVHAGQLLGIPAELGKIISAYQGRQKTVVLIQDLHCHAEVQHHIADIILHLADLHNLKLIAEEGAYDRVDTSVLGHFPIESIRRQISDWFITQGMISGAEHAAILRPEAFDLVGLESRDLYQTSQSVVKKILNSESLGFLYDLQDLVNDLKPIIYHDELSHYDRHYVAYQQGRQPVIDLIAHMKKTIAKHNLFAHQSDRFQVSRLLTQLNNQDQLDLNQLNNDIQQMDRQIRSQLYRHADQEKLDTMIARLHTMERLLNISATRDDLDDFKQNPGDYQVKPFLDFIQQAARSSEEPVDVWQNLATTDFYRLDETLQQVNQFYQLADLRSHAFVSNIINQMDQSGESLAVMTHGGFHSEDIMSALRARDISFLTVRPQVNNLDIVNPYFDLIQDKQSSLEQLLAKNQTIMAILSRFKRPGSQKTFQLAAQVMAKQAMQVKVVPKRTLKKVAAFIEQQKMRELQEMSDDDQAGLAVLDDTDYFWIENQVGRVPMIRVPNRGFTDDLRKQFKTIGQMSIGRSDIIIFISWQDMQAAHELIKQHWADETSWKLFNLFQKRNILVKQFMNPLLNHERYGELLKNYLKQSEMSQIGLQQSLEMTMGKLTSLRKKMAQFAAKPTYQNLKKIEKLLYGQAEPLLLAQVTSLLASYSLIFACDHYERHLEIPNKGLLITSDSAQIWVGGSLARNEYTSASDIDVRINNTSKELRLHAYMMNKLHFPDVDSGPAGQYDAFELFKQTQLYEERPLLPTNQKNSYEIWDTTERTLAGSHSMSVRNLHELLTALIFSAAALKINKKKNWLEKIIRPGQLRKRKIAKNVIRAFERVALMIASTRQLKVNNIIDLVHELDPSGQNADLQALLGEYQKWVASRQQLAMGKKISADQLLVTLNSTLATFSPIIGTLTDISEKDKKRLPFLDIPITIEAVKIKIDELSDTLSTEVAELEKALPAHMSEPYKVKDVHFFFDTWPALFNLVILYASLKLQTDLLTISNWKKHAEKHEIKLNDTSVPNVAHLEDGLAFLRESGLIHFPDFQDAAINRPKNFVTQIRLGLTVLKDYLLSLPKREEQIIHGGISDQLRKIWNRGQRKIGPLLGRQANPLTMDQYRAQAANRENLMVLLFGSLLSVLFLIGPPILGLALVNPEAILRFGFTLSWLTFLGLHIGGATQDEDRIWAFQLAIVNVLLLQLPVVWPYYLAIIAVTFINHHLINRLLATNDRWALIKARLKSIVLPESTREVGDTSLSGENETLKDLLQQLLSLPADQQEQLEAYLGDLIEYQESINDYLANQDYDQAGELLLAGLGHPQVNLTYDELEQYFAVFKYGQQWQWIGRLLVGAIEQPGFSISREQVQVWLTLLQSNNMAQESLTVMEAVLNQSSWAVVSGDTMLAWIAWLKEHGRSKISAKLVERALEQRKVRFDQDQVEKLLAIINDVPDPEEIIVVYGRLIQQQLLSAENRLYQTSLTKLAANQQNLAKEAIMILVEERESNRLAALFNTAIINNLPRRLNEAATMAMAAHRLGIDVNQAVGACLQQAVDTNQAGLAARLAIVTLTPNLILPNNYTIEEFVDYVFANAFAGFGVELAVKALRIGWTGDDSSALRDWILKSIQIKQNLDKTYLLIKLSIEKNVFSAKTGIELLLELLELEKKQQLSIINIILVKMAKGEADAIIGYLRELIEKKRKQAEIKKISPKTQERGNSSSPSETKTSKVKENTYYSLLNTLFKQKEYINVLELEYFIKNTPGSQQMLEKRLPDSDFDFENYEYLLMAFIKNPTLHGIIEVFSFMIKQKVPVRYASEIARILAIYTILFCVRTAKGLSDGMYSDQEYAIILFGSATKVAEWIPGVSDLDYAFLVLQEGYDFNISNLYEKMNRALRNRGFTLEESVSEPMTLTEHISFWEYQPWFILDYKYLAGGFGGKLIIDEMKEQALQKVKVMAFAQIESLEKIDLMHAGASKRLAFLIRAMTMVQHDEKEFYFDKSVLRLIPKFISSDEAKEIIYHYHKIYELLGHLALIDKPNEHDLKIELEKSEKYLNTEFIKLTRKFRMALSNNAIRPAQAWRAFSFSLVAAVALAVVGVLSGEASLWSVSAGLLVVMGGNWLMSVLGAILPQRAGPAMVDSHQLIPFLQSVQPGPVSFMEWMPRAGQPPVLTMNTRVYQFLAQRSKVIQRLLLYPLGIVSHEIYHQLNPTASEKQTYAFAQIIPAAVGASLFGSLAWWLAGSTVWLVLGSIAGAGLAASGVGYWLWRGSGLVDLNQPLSTANHHLNYNQSPYNPIIRILERYRATVFGAFDFTDTANISYQTNPWVLISKGKNSRLQIHMPGWAFRLINNPSNNWFVRLGRRLVATWLHGGIQHYRWRTWMSNDRAALKQKMVPLVEKLRRSTIRFQWPWPVLWGMTSTGDRVFAGIGFRPFMTMTADADQRTGGSAPALTSAEITKISNLIKKLQEMKYRLEHNKFARTVYLPDQHGEPGMIKKVDRLVEKKLIDRVIVLGDAFDRGAYNLDVYKKMKKLQTELGDRFVYVLGNHDIAMIKAVLFDDPSALVDWNFRGGSAFLKEIGVPDKQIVFLKELHTTYLRSRIGYKNRLKLVQLTDELLEQYTQDAVHRDLTELRHYFAQQNMNQIQMRQIEELLSRVEETVGANDNLNSIRHIFDLKKPKRIPDVDQDDIRDLIKRHYAKLKPVALWLLINGQIDTKTEMGGAAVHAAYPLDEETASPLLSNEELEAIKARLSAVQAKVKQTTDLGEQDQQEISAIFDVTYQFFWGEDRDWFGKLKDKALDLDQRKTARLLDEYEFEYAVYGHMAYDDFKFNDHRFYGADIGGKGFVIHDFEGIQSFSAEPDQMITADNLKTDITNEKRIRLIDERIKRLQALLPPEVAQAAEEPELEAKLAGGESNKAYLDRVAQIINPVDERVFSKTAVNIGSLSDEKLLKLLAASRADQVIWLDSQQAVPDTAGLKTMLVRLGANNIETEEQSNVSHDNRISVTFTWLGKPHQLTVLGKVDEKSEQPYGNVLNTLGEIDYLFVALPNEAQHAALIGTIIQNQLVQNGYVVAEPNAVLNLELIETVHPGDGSLQALETQDNERDYITDNNRVSIFKKKVSPNQSDGNQLLTELGGQQGAAAGSSKRRIKKPAPRIYDDRGMIDERPPWQLSWQQTVSHQLSHVLKQWSTSQISLIRQLVHRWLMRLDPKDYLSNAQSSVERQYPGLAGQARLAAAVQDEASELGQAYLRMAKNQTPQHRAYFMHLLLDMIKTSGNHEQQSIEWVYLSELCQAMPVWSLATVATWSSPDLVWLRHRTQQLKVPRFILQRSRYLMPLADPSYQLPFDLINNLKHRWQRRPRRLATDLAA